jgi:hypothetical protein
MWLYSPGHTETRHLTHRTKVSFRQPRLGENQLLGKALAERHQQLEGTIEPNLPPQQCPHYVFFGTVPT